MTLDADGYFTLTKARPIIKRGRVYVKAGEPIGYRHICKTGAARLFGVTDATPLVPVRVEVSGRVIS